MLLATTDQTLLAQFLLFLSAFAGPQGNLDKTTTWQQKINALANFAQTGDARACKKVLAAIRKNKAWAEDFFAKGQKAKQGIEEGIRNLQRIMKNAGAQAARRQREIESLKRTLETLKSEELWLPRLIAGRAKEEKAFLLLYRCIEKGRKKLAAP
jgi:hypothetical protein